jgi:hypothetical protein
MTNGGIGLVQTKGMRLLSPEKGLSRQVLA